MTNQTTVVFLIQDGFFFQEILKIGVHAIAEYLM